MTQPRNPEQIDYINAHGTGTLGPTTLPKPKRSERSIGTHKMMVSSTKSMRRPRPWGSRSPGSRS